MFFGLRSFSLFLVLISCFSLYGQASQERDEYKKQIYLRTFFAADLSGKIIAPGASLSFVPWKALEITVGSGGQTFFDDDSQFLLFSKIGWAFEFDLRSKDSGVIIRIPIALGWRYSSISIHRDSELSNERMHSLNFSVGLEFVAMFSKVFGMSVNANFATDVIVAYRYHDRCCGDVWSDVPSERMLFFFDGGLINFVFRFK